MPVTLTKPVAFFDLETTGLDVKNDRIVQISILRWDPISQEERVITKLVNPGIPIPPSASQIHGITDEMVAREKTFGQIARELADELNGTDLCGYNILRFDIPFIKEEFSRAGITFPALGTRTFDAMTIYHRMEPRDLTAALKFYCNKTMRNAHDAEADTRASFEVFREQLVRYPQLGENGDDLYQFCAPPNQVDEAGKLILNKDREPVFAFGRHKGQLVLEHVDYAEWMISHDFPEETKVKLREIISNVKNPAHK